MHIFTFGYTVFSFAFIMWSHNSSVHLEAYLSNHCALAGMFLNHDSAFAGTFWVMIQHLAGVFLLLSHCLAS